MNVAKLRFLAQLWILLAVMASTALLMDSLGGTPAYCSGAGGCLAAKHAAREWLGPVPLPLLGVLAFVTWFVVTTLARTQAVLILEFGGTLVAAASGIGLLLVQALVLRTFCPLCVVVDVSAIAASLTLALARRRAQSDAGPSHFLGLQASLCLCVVAIVGPAIWPYFRPVSRVPSELAPLQIPNRVTVVEFVDLECGHCRVLHPTLEQLRQEYADRIHFVRLHAPLRSHRVARLGARLIACLEPDQTRIDLLNQSLFDGPDVDETSVRAAAEGLGLSESEIEGCWSDPRSDAMVDQNLQRLEALGFEGLPTTYVAGERIVGAMPWLVYAAAIDRASRSSDLVGLESVAFYLVFAALIAGLVWLGRRAQRHAASEDAARQKP